ncbi:hypothetical protein MTR67_043064 [Solanum verrucosum]|uniref:Reverse transcriptase domain-containing protein n=1 Tax=Solanum verrucosum TaxID=315347 RepID=A0AAF0UR32_SOLVR|nr:hypothetical protein MTR67_043064 [Solanum verrucosum]
MEGLNHMFRKAKTNGWVRGFSAQAGMEITHLFYADDALIFCEAEETQTRHLRTILTIFEGISGLHVNWLKSHLFPINNVDNMSRLAETLGCQVDALPTKYLGLPLGAKNKELEVWNVVLERCERKLAKWKSQYLSLGGRVTLIKSVLDGLPTYMMSLFPIPKNIEKKINRLRRTFLWQGNKEKGGYNLSVKRRRLASLRCTCFPEHCEKVSGSWSTNLNQCVIPAPNAQPEAISRVESITGTERKFSPIEYLGCPLYVGRKKISIFS